MNRIAIAVVLTLVGFASGCSGPSDGDPDGSVDGAPLPAIPIRIGTGTTNFEEIPDGGALPLIKGPQGGIHFIVNARTPEMDQPGNQDDPGDQSNPITKFEAFASDGGVLNWDLPPYHLGFFPSESGPAGWEIGGHILRILIPDGETPDTYVAKILGKSVRIKVTVEQVNGRMGSDETVITVAPNP